MNSQKLLEVLDHFLEAVARGNKRRALAPVEKKMEALMARVFRKQGSVFLRELRNHRSQFAEAMGADELASIMGAVETETAGEMTLGMRVLAGSALASGFKNVPDFGVALEFDLANSRAQEWLAGHAAEMVTQINATTRDELAAILSRGAENGWNYDKTAREIKSRFSEFAVGKPQQHIDSRAHLVAINESSIAFEQGSRQAALELAEAGLVIEKSWQTVGDDRVTDECAENEGAEWIGLDDTFPSGDTEPPRFPSCLPSGQRVIADNILGATKRFFNGDLVVLTTASGNKLACTPNHPILTPEGWIAAGQLDIGSDVICAFGREFAEAASDMNDQKGPAAIEKITSAFGRSVEVSSEVVKVSAPHFHGDGKGSEVATVWANRFLRDGQDASVSEQLRQQLFIWSKVRGVLFATMSHFAAFFKRMFPALAGFVSSFGILGILFGAPAGHHQPICLNDITGLDTKVLEPPDDDLSANAVSLRESILGKASIVKPDEFCGGDIYSSGQDHRGVVSDSGNTGGYEVIVDSALGDTELLCERVLGSSAQVFFDQIVDRRRIPFSGHVYNLQTGRGFYVAETIITHNCRCTTLYRTKGTED